MASRPSGNFLFKRESLPVEWRRARKRTRPAGRKMIFSLYFDVNYFLGTNGENAVSKGATVREVTVFKKLPAAGGHA